MGFDVSKVRAAHEELDEIKRRTDLGAVRAASAALGSVDVRGASAALEAMRRLQGGSLGAGLDSARSFGALDASVKPLAQGATALPGLPKGSALSVAAGIPRKPPWATQLSSIAEAMAKKPALPNVFSNIQASHRQRTIETFTSLAVGTRNQWELDSTRAMGIDVARMIKRYEATWANSAQLYGAGSMAKNAAVLGGPFGTFSEIAKQVQKSFSWMEHLRPYLEHWARIAEDARRFAERVASQPAWPEDDLLAFAAYDALEAMEAGRHWVAVDFLRRHLNLRPTPERLEALWLLLKRGFDRPFDSPPRWLTLGQDKARAYLATAVYRGAERIRRQRQMEDNIWGKANGKELVRPGGGWLVYIEDQPTDAFVSPDLNPAKLIELKMDDCNQILDELLATGTPADRQIISLIRTGNYDRADIRNIVGSSRLQAFERKIQRRWKNGRI